MPSATTAILDTQTATSAGVELPEMLLMKKTINSISAKLSKIVVICKQEKLSILQSSLNQIGVNGMTVTQAPKRQ